MDRLKINIPDKKPHYVHPISIRVTDLNYGNHLANDRLIGLIHESRCQYLRSLDQSELNFFESSLIMSDLRCQYLNQGFLHDQLEISIYVEIIHPKAFCFFYEVKNQENKLVLARLMTTMCCYNYQRQKIESIPQKFIGLF